VFDDLVLPFQQTMAEASLTAWVSGTRPLLMFTYWLNHELSTGGTFGYHLVNVIIHAANTTLVFVILQQLLMLANWPPRRRVTAAALGAAVFLAHPLATESVSYIAGRSESLAALFVLSAYLIFLRSEEPMRWRDAFVILLLFGCGLATKENAVALAGILLLTDWFFPRAGPRRLYLLMVPAAALAAGLVLRVLVNAPTAGFGLRDFTWYQYGLTQARAIFAYVRLAMLPWRQSLDHDFPISRTVFDHGAWFWVSALGALIVAAIAYRKRFPLASFGFLMFLIWLAPTSSVIPIADPMVERRVYLPLMGLILMATDALSRLRVPRAAYACALCALAVLTWQRNLLWGHPEELLADAARQSIHNPRPFANLTEGYIAENRCQDALPWLQRAERSLPRNYIIQASLGRVLECMGRREEALGRLNAALSMHPNSKLYELIGLLYGEMNQLEASGNALRKAVAMDPQAVSPHRSLALWHEARHDGTAAEAEYRSALALDPNDTQARIGLARVRANSAARDE